MRLWVLLMVLLPALLHNIYVRKLYLQVNIILTSDRYFARSKNKNIFDLVKAQSWFLAIAQILFVYFMK